VTVTATNHRETLDAALDAITARGYWSAYDEPEDVRRRGVVRDGELVVRQTGTIAVTFDHRVVDGARASEFGQGVIRRLEDPSVLS
jgi:2-oxoacid dehydrogenases acyltransferase (catalytic domain)